MKKTLTILTLSLIVFLNSYSLALAEGKCECVEDGKITRVKNYVATSEACELFCGESVLSNFIEYNDNSSATLDNPVGTNNISVLIGRIIQAFLGIIGSISLVMFIYAGFMLMTAQGKTAQIQKGRDTMLWAAIGILIVFASYTILNFVFNVFGV